MNVRTLGRAFLVAVLFASSVIAGACSSASTAGDSSTPNPDASVGGDDASAADSSPQGNDAGDAGSTDTGSDAANTFVGSVSGHSLNAADSVSHAKPNFFIVRITDYGNACGRINQKANGNDFELSFPSMPTPGTYQVIHLDPAAAGQVVTVFEGWGASPSFGTCNLAFQVNGDSGMVHVTEADATHVSGTFDVLFGADHVTGSFRATPCATLTILDAGCGS